MPSSKSFSEVVATTPPGALARPDYGQLFVELKAALDEVHATQEGAVAMLECMQEMRERAYDAAHSIEDPAKRRRHLEGMDHLLRRIASTAGEFFPNSAES